MVTGGAGFIGSNFIHFLLKNYDDIKVINYDKLTYAGNIDNLKDVEHDSRYNNTIELAGTKTFDDCSITKKLFEWMEEPFEGDSTTLEDNDDGQTNYFIGISFHPPYDADYFDDDAPMLPVLFCECYSDKEDLDFHKFLTNAMEKFCKEWDITNIIKTQEEKDSHPPEYAI